MVEPLTDKELDRERRYAEEGHECTGPMTLRILATIARLQERVEEAERKWNLAVGDRDACLSELAKAEALAERRKEALGDMGDNPDCLQCRDNKERAHTAIEEEGKR